MARMAGIETNLGTGGSGEDRKKTPEEIAEERIVRGLRAGVDSPRPFCEAFFREDRTFHS